MRTALIIAGVVLLVAAGVFLGNLLALALVLRGWL